MSLKSGKHYSCLSLLFSNAWYILAIATKQKGNGLKILGKNYFYMLAYLKNETPLKSSISATRQYNKMADTR